MLGDHIETGLLREKVRHGDGRARLDPAVIRAALLRLEEMPGDDPAFPLRLIGLRELRSHNSWMHNAPLLLRGGRTQTVRVHPDDAAGLGVRDGETVEITSRRGTVTVPVRVTDELMPGTVALPHGWGHRGGWRLANALGGVNSNELASAHADDVEPYSGMAWLTGIPVRLAPVGTPVTAQAPDGSVAVA